jgi:hypothetical protein
MHVGIVIANCKPLAKPSFANSNNTQVPQLHIANHKPNQALTNCNCMWVLKLHMGHMKDCILELYTHPQMLDVSNNQTVT